VGIGEPGLAPLLTALRYHLAELPNIILAAAFDSGHCREFIHGQMAWV
jgi:hypothetical protein